MTKSAPISAADPVRSVTAWGPEYAAATDSLQMLAEAMADANCSALLVRTRNGELAIVSERDIVRSVAAGSAAHDWVFDVMTRQVLAVTADESIADVADLMLGAEIRHVIVNDEDRNRVGIVSMRDLIEPLLAAAG